MTSRRRRPAPSRMPTNLPAGTTETEASRTERPPVAVVMLGAGVMSFAALNMIRLGLRHDPRMHVPTPIAFVLAFVMLTGSMMAVLTVLGRAEYVNWLAAPLLLGMTVLFGWVGLYGDPHYCSSGGPVWMPVPSCHVAFTGAAMLLLLMTWLVARSWWRGRPGRSRAAD